MPLRLRITGDGLRITGPSRGPSRPRPPQPQVLLRTENGEALVNERGEHLILETRHGQ